MGSFNFLIFFFMIFSFQTGNCTYCRAEEEICCELQDVTTVFFAVLRTVSTDIT